jgi:hypothetical protein
MTLLREFMTAENFTAAVRKLAEPICRRFDLPDVYQLGLVVPNAVAADEAMVRDWGLDPAFMLDGEVPQWIENGKELRVGLAPHRSWRSLPPRRSRCSQSFEPTSPRRRNRSGSSGIRYLPRVYRHR